MSIRKNKVLSAALGSPDAVSVGGGGTTLRSPVYNLIPVDLRTPPVVSLEPLLGSGDDPLLSPSLPTLLLFECVLAYMAPSASNALIQWFVDYFVSPAGGGLLGAVVYEMFKLGDAFGRVMLTNLKSRGVTLPGAEAQPDIASLSNRFLGLGFTSAQALTLREIRSRYIGPEERQQLSQLEMLDEVEELELVLDHYAISWGIRFPENWPREGSGVWGLTTKDQIGSADDGDDCGP